MGKPVCDYASDWLENIEEAYRSGGYSGAKADIAAQGYDLSLIMVINWHPDCDAHALEFVHWVRIQPQLHATPVIVFTKDQLSFAAQERAQHEGVTELIVRPDTFEALLEQVQALLDRCVSRCVVR